MANICLHCWYVIWFIDVLAVRDAVAVRLKKDLRAAYRSVGYVGHASPTTSELSGRFKVQNRATVPVNLLGLSSAVRAHAVVHNSVWPSETREFATYLVWYDLHLSIAESNEWSKGKEQSWGLFKNLTTTGVSHVLHAGVTGKVAIHAGIAVATALTVVVAPPVAIAAGIIAGGAAGVATALAVSQLTEASFDLSREALNRLLQEEEQLPQESKVGDGLFRFCHVVKEPDVRAAYVSALKQEGFVFSDEDPEMALHQITMTQATAEAYYAATHAKFSTSKLATSEERQLEILGGFTKPSAHASIAGLQIVEFTPLHIRELEPGYGCVINQAQDKTYWRSKYAECQSQCEGLKLAKKRHIKACIEECHELLEAPKNAEEELFSSEGLDSEIRELMEHTKSKMIVAKDKSLILRASRAAGLTSDANDDKRLSFSGRSVIVKTWNPRDFTASAVVGRSDWDLPVYVQFPLEVLLASEEGQPVFTEEHRVIFQSLQFGECWSRSATNSMWNNTRSIFAGGAWCHSSNHEPGGWCKDGNAGCPFNFGKVCMPNVDRCALVSEDREFHCVD